MIFKAPQWSMANTGGAVGGELGKELRQTGQVHVLLIDDILLAQGDDLLRHGEDVPLLINGQDVLSHQLAVVLADLDEMGLDGAPVIIAEAGMDGEGFILVGR